MKYLSKVQMCVAMGKTNATARSQRLEGWRRHAAWMWVFPASSHADCALLHRDDAVRVAADYPECTDRDDGKTCDNKKADNNHTANNHDSKNNHDYASDNHDSTDNHNCTSYNDNPACNYDNKANNSETNHSLVETTTHDSEHQYSLVEAHHDSEHH